MRAALLLALLLAGHAHAAAPEREMQVFFVEKRIEYVATDALAPGEAKGYRFQVAIPNVTRVEFVLRPDEAAGEPAAWTLTAKGPGGWVVAPPSSSRGETRIESPFVHELPPVMTVRADELDETLREHASRAGMGTWTATVQVNPLTGPGSATSFRLAAFVHHYEAVPMRVVSLSDATTDAWTADPRPWLATLALLALFALVLGVGLVRQASLRTRSRVHLPGDNSPPPRR